MHEKEPWNNFDFVGPEAKLYQSSPEGEAKIDAMNRAREEAMDRVMDLGDPHNLVMLTNDKSMEDLENYLKENITNLTSEEQFFLQATIGFRKTIAAERRPNQK